QLPIVFLTIFLAPNPFRVCARSTSELLVYRRSHGRVHLGQGSRRSHRPMCSVRDHVSLVRKNILVPCLGALFPGDARLSVQRLESTLPPSLGPRQPSLLIASCLPRSNP